MGRAKAQVRTGAFRLPRGDTKSTGRRRNDPWGCSVGIQGGDPGLMPSVFTVSSIRRRISNVTATERGFSQIFLTDCQIEPFARADKIGIATPPSVGMIDFVGLLIPAGNFASVIEDIAAKLWGAFNTVEHSFLAGMVLDFHG